MTSAAAPFDAIAARYDELWTNTGAGRLQREAVWRKIDPLPRIHVILMIVREGNGVSSVGFR